MRIYGITGGIASGKSTVARLFAEKGAAILDGDQIARQVSEPGQPAYQDIVQAFGRTVVLPDGTLDRKQLGTLVFSDRAKRNRLEAITHPRIAEATARALGELAEKHVPLAFYEATLLVENRAFEWLDGLIVVVADSDQQVDRAIRRDGFTRKEVEQRIAAQSSESEKTKHALHVIDTRGTLADTARQVDQIWQALQGSRST